MAYHLGTCLNSGGIDCYLESHATFIQSTQLCLSNPDTLCREAKAGEP